MEHFTEIVYQQSLPVLITRHKTEDVQQEEIARMHWDITKLLSLGVSEEFLKEGVTPMQARELLKGLLYLKERYESNN